MNVIDGKIIACTEPELFKQWLRRGLYEIYGFEEYRRRCVAAGVEIMKEAEEE